MTLNFIPGEVNDGETSVLHGQWKNHYIVVYGSGNNLIISSLTLKDQQIFEHLQTIYLEADPQSIDFNYTNGFISISVGNNIIIYKPMNEYMSKPQWIECLVIKNYDDDDLLNGVDHQDNMINCVQWAPIENELIIGTNNSIILYKIYEEYGDWKFHKRWYQQQPLPVTSIKITFNSNRIIVKNGPFDGILKLWNRINYGDDNTLFELVYLPNPIGDFIVDFKWRYRTYNELPIKITDEAMANIKNISNYIDNGNVDSDTLYTFSYKKIFKVWTTFEFSGHDHIKCWGEIELPDTINVIVIDNYYIKNHGDNGDYDLLLAINQQGQVKKYKIHNISNIPHDSVKFELVNDETTSHGMQLSSDNYLHIHTTGGGFDEDPKNFEMNCNPVIIPKISFFNDKNLAILFHNRLKSTIKLNSLHLPDLNVKLVNKFQGHEKSIRKLIKSNPFYNKENILLSILNFPQHNYIWQPLVLEKPIQITIITKKFQIDLTLIKDDEQPHKSIGEMNCILDAAIINDINESSKRHHLVITFDKLGNLSLWSCNGSKEDKPGELLRCENLKMINKPPLVFQLIEYQLNDILKEYLLIAIFELNNIKAWKLKIFKKKLKIEMKKFSINSLPDFKDLQNINKIETLVNQQDKNLVSIIDKLGNLKIFKIKINPDNIEWIETFSLNTNIPNVSKLIGSSIINKLAIIDESGKNLYIWDLKSEILEYQESFDDEVKDIDWCLIDSNNQGQNLLLSIGFKRHVLLYTELRYDYTNKIPSYSVLKKIDISNFTSHEIGDSIWINNGYLVIGCGNQFFIDDRWFEVGSSSDNFVNSNIKQLLKGVKGESIFDISDIIKILNGPLPIYHPQFLIQLLYMNEFNLVKMILIKLFKALRNDEMISWNLGIKFINEILHERDIDEDLDDGDIFETFNDNLIELLINNLTKTSLPFITRHQQITLTSIIKIIVIINKYYKVLDENGIRFLIGFKLFQLSKQSNLNMRDINFAVHSNQKDLILTIIEDSYPKLTWDIIRSLKLVYWVNEFKLLEIIENISRNEFSDKRDPLGLISLFYVALNKKQILIGLWKTISHKEKDKMIKFLSNDFNDERWKVAAMKNAFALLGKHRYLDSAYFFLLADKLDDCVNVLNNKLGEFELSLIISKLYQFVRNNNEKPNNLKLIEKYLLCETIENGNKWINSWIYWEINEKKLSIDALIKSPLMIAEIQSTFNIPNNLNIKISSNKFLNDDPALILLYKSLKFKSDIVSECQFLLKICKIYEKLGCDYLSILLLYNWEFSYPNTEKQQGFQNHEKQLPPQIAFEEPDMSSFDFGF